MRTIIAIAAFAAGTAVGLATAANIVASAINHPERGPGHTHLRNILKEGLNQ